MISQLKRVKCKRCKRTYKSYMTIPSYICERPDCIEYLYKLYERRESDKRFRVEK